MSLLSSVIMNVRERQRGSTHGQRDWSARLKLMFMKLITNSWEIWAHSQLICHRASWLMWAADGRSVGFFFFCFVQSVFLCLWPTLSHLKLKKNEAVAPWTETRVNVSLSNYSVVPPLAARASCRRIEQRRSGVKWSTDVARKQKLYEATSDLSIWANLRMLRSKPAEQTQIFSCDVQNDETCCIGLS